MEFPSGTPRWRRYLRFWRRDVQGDIDDELRFHFDARIGALRDRGVTEDAAQRQATEEFGDVGEVRRGLRAIDERIERREERAEWLDGWRQDLRYAARSLRRTPAVTITILVTLALGIGANTAMFSLLDAIFLRPPSGVVQPERVRRVWSERTFRSGKQYWPGYAYPHFAAVSESIEPLGRVAIYRYPQPVKFGRGRDATRATVTSISTEYFALLGARPALGRFIAADENRMGFGARVAVVSHAFWRRSLGADTSALGESIYLDNEPYTVIGVADPDFTGVDIDAVDVWTPVATITWSGPGAPWWTETYVNGFQMLVRLSDGVSDAAVDTRLTMVMRRDAELRAGWDSTSVTQTGPILRARGPGKVDQEVRIATRLGGVALVVLVIACANVVNLLLVRAVRRRREIAVRLSLGISARRLTRLLFAESLLLALGAGIVAVLVAQWGGALLRALLLPNVHWAHAPVGWRVILMSATIALAAGTVAAAVPAMQAVSTELTDALKAGAREGHVRRSRLRSFLLATQAALSVVLLVGAVLFARSLDNVRRLDLGFDPSRLLFAHVSFEGRDKARDALVPTRLDELATQLAGRRGIENAATITRRPLGGFSTASYYPDTDTLANKKPEGFYWGVSPEYFATARIQLLSGDGFPPAGSDTPPSVVVNDAMARALWPGQNPIGRCVRFEKPDARCNFVIGVVETARRGAVIEEATPQFYLPLANMPFRAYRENVIAVRVSDSNFPAVAARVREALGTAFPDGEPSIQLMSAMLEPHYRPWRLGATLFTLFGALAVLVAAVGIYSTVSYSVSQRTHEFGVRVALGARLVDIVRSVLGEGLRTVVVGAVIGVALTLAAGRLVASLLYGIEPTDPIVIALVVLALIGVTTAATLLPARRAARVDPLTALRTE
jgi:putative ABC transport system permease protein